MTPPSWRIRIGRWLVALVTLGIVYQAYALLAVPVIEPSLRARDTAKSVIAPSHRANDPVIDALFPADAWERNNPKVLQTQGAKLLFREYSRSDDGRMELRPCTIIFEAPGGDAKGRRRLIVLQAPQKATLSFSAPLDLARGQISRLKGALLEGEIRIFSPPTAQGANDALNIVTRNIQILPKQIWTPHEVWFQYGSSHGKGRDLSITLSSPEDDRPAQGHEGLVKNVQSLELGRIDKLFLRVPTKGGLLGPFHGAGDAAPDSRSVAGVVRSPSTEVEITCRGPFQFNFRDGVASLEDQVHVVHVNPAGESDQLSCDLLRIFFELPADEPNGEHQPPAPAGARAGRDEARRPLAVRRIEAKGTHVELRAPSIATEAHGETLAYDFKERRIVLTDKRKASLVYRRHQAEAQRLEYVLHEQPKRLGRLAADGPGVYQGHFGENADQLLKVTWSGQLLLQPQEGFHVLSAVQGADITWDEMGHFTADELYLWLVETPVASARPADAGSQDSQDSSMPELAPATTLSAREPTITHGQAPEPKRWEVRPVKMLARGNVRADSKQFQGDTPLLEIWFQHPAEETKQTPRAENNNADPAAQATERPTKPQSSRSDQRLELAGQRIRVQVLMLKPRPKLREATITGGVRLTRVASRPGGLPLVVSGDMLQLRTDHLDRSDVHVRGAPARIQAQGMSLEGANLHVSQRENRMWAAGPGRMKLPARIKMDSAPRPGADPHAARSNDIRGDRSKSETARSNTPVWISWQGSMDFDGQLVRFLRQVEVRAEHVSKKNERMNMLAIGDQLHATLNQYVAFEKPRQPDGLDVVELRFLGEVFTENQTFNGQDIITSRDRMKSRDMTLDRRTGKFHALGPGWITSTRYDRGNLGGRMGANSAARTPVRQPNRGLGRRVYLRVDYQNAIEGNIDRRMVEFKNYVRAVYGPVESWDQVLDPDRRGGLGRQGIVMTCNHLFLSELEQANQRAITISAVGNTQVEGSTFMATADRMTYDESKDQLIFDAAPESFARFQQRSRSGEQPNEFYARKIMYWLSTGQYQVFGARKLDYSYRESRNLPRARLR